MLLGVAPIKASTVHSRCLELSETGPPPHHQMDQALPGLSEAKIRDQAISIGEIIPEAKSPLLAYADERCALPYLVPH